MSQSLTIRNNPAKRAHSLVRRLFERRGATVAALLITAAAGGLGYYQIVSNLLIVSVLATVVFYEFTRRIDQGLPLMQLGALLACLQWLVGPMMSYLSSSHHDRYFMYVPEEYYFSYAMPASAAYIFGMLAGAGSLRQRPAMHRVDRRKFVPIGISLNLVALAAEYGSGKVPSGLAFLFHLLTQLHYVGALYFLLSGSPWRWHLVALSTFQLFWESSVSGMFHDLILWSTLIFTFWFAMQRRDTALKAGLIIMAILSVIGVQLVKQSMREKWSRGQSTTFSGELMNLVTGRSDAYSESALTLASARLNQGWIISAVMANVPRFEPFCDGETVGDAVLSSALPRFLWADKKKAGGQENFRRFTGLPLEETTSMGLSVLGEAYANFGTEGGILFMGLMGTAFAYSFRLLTRLVLKHPTFLFWIPLIYYQAVKAETELVVVMNQVVKGTFVAFAGYWICAQYLKQDEGLMRQEGMNAEI